MPAPQEHKSLARNIGEFFGHIIRGFRTKPTTDRETKIISSHVEEERRGDVTLRRTTIEEVEFRGTDPESGPDKRSN